MLSLVTDLRHAASYSQNYRVCNKMDLKVQSLLTLLDEVEEELEPGRLQLDAQLGRRLVDRLRDVANKLEDLVYPESDEEDLSSRPQAGASAVISQTAGSRPRREDLDEPTRKRQREAADLAERLGKKTKSVSCGCSYQDNEEEHKFSENNKKEIKRMLPKLKTHKLLFHYMVSATQHRLKCEHCGQCPNLLECFDS